MVGFLGKKGLWLDSIGAICQRVNPDGQLGAEFTTRTVGGTGGGTEGDRCLSGSVVASFFATSGSFVEIIRMNCVGWDQNNKRPFPLDPNAPVNSDTLVGLGHWTEVLGYNQSPLNPRNQGFACPLPKVGKALRGRYGIYIDSMRFVCDDWDK